jgi:molybdopterin-guanine dinucleotide biosynthesis protein A
MPGASKDAVQWLLDQRKTELQAITPRLNNNEFIEPLFAWYNTGVLHYLEQMADEKNFSLQSLKTFPKISKPAVPEKLKNAWENINEELS